MPASWTIKALVTWTTQYFRDKGIESPRLEAELLLAHALNCRRIDLLVNYDAEPLEAERATFRELVRRRAEHWPTAYLIGQREFFLLPFDVSPAVLIPRPETETLVLAALDELRTRPSARVLELGTGSGCIAVSIGKQCPDATIVAIDVSPDALEIAKANARRHGVEARIDFRQGDWFSPLGEESFDLIVSNPPYVTTAEIETLAAEVREHEPRHALDGGPDGLAFYRRIAADGARHLASGGLVAVEVGANQAEAVVELFRAADLVPQNVLKDAAGIARVVLARRQ